MKYLGLDFHRFTIQIGLIWLPSPSLQAWKWESMVYTLKVDIFDPEFGFSGGNLSEVSSKVEIIPSFEEDQCLNPKDSSFFYQGNCLAIWLSSMKKSCTSLNS